MNYVNVLQGICCEAFWAASIVSKFKCRHYNPMHALELTDIVHDSEAPDLELLQRVFFVDTFFPADNEPTGDAVVTSVQSDRQQH